ncbi:hypothetical protein BLS_004038 [Venturia inaequalis]|uniref:NADH-ubiquinone oxidoreductase 29.9 kDa subunit n=1 Tax=Venturia inaequalis TaxID=5025 RepID=A0A8H3ULS2_VENIN|nr:hypothetical protein BLS_004038 [Venturia inaequalis]KAE9993764.1 hypothetical protein EG327_003526 [Venturia inaequalis]RDI78748.1 hypothetical protein Vi05172_g11280 [Venturia inaequalis]
MRPALRLFAAVRGSIEPGAPTGLTGLVTHPAPRSTLMYLYSTTLTKLQHIPESSVYRQSVEALTKKRLAIVEAQTAPGHFAWLDTMRLRITEFQEQQKAAGLPVQGDNLQYEGNEYFLASLGSTEIDEREVEWDGEPVVEPTLEGPRSAEELAKEDAQIQKFSKTEEEKQRFRLKLDPEPLLSRDQIEDIENKIGGGLIEEVIQVAQGELKLVDTMIESKAWESLIEPAPEGQWSYFERGLTHTTTQ